jgi:hypothetical protein
MKIRVVVSCGMLLTLGTALAGTLIYEQRQSATLVTDQIGVGCWRRLGHKA